MDEATVQHPLCKLVEAIVRGDHAHFSALLDNSPALAAASFSQGATRQTSSLHFVEEAGRYIYSRDTALHFAAACYRKQMADELMKAGALVRAKNRRGAEPLHAAVVGAPDSLRWNPAAQVATIVCLIQAGADPNAQNMDGVTPLHCAVRTRCADAVRALLDHGADPSIRNKSGSIAMQLAVQTTGRSGSGLPEAKAQQRDILQLLQSRAGAYPAQ